jgi:hypothetical protein
MSSHVQSTNWQRGERRLNPHHIATIKSNSSTNRIGKNAIFIRDIVSLKRRKNRHFRCLRGPRAAEKFGSEQALGRGVTKEKERIFIKAIAAGKCARCQTSQPPTPLPCEDGIPSRGKLFSTWRRPCKRNREQRNVILVNAACTLARLISVITCGVSATEAARNEPIRKRRVVLEAIAKEPPVKRRASEACEHPTPAVAHGKTSIFFL